MIAYSEQRVEMYDGILGVLLDNSVSADLAAANGHSEQIRHHTLVIGIGRRHLHRPNCHRHSRPRDHVLCEWMGGSAPDAVECC